MKKQKERNTKALVLLSGGLDSRLALKIMQKQLGKDNVEALFFILPFGGGCCSDKLCVFRFSQMQGSKLNIIDVTKGELFKEYIEMLKSPKHGRGTALNPCIDCHLFMLKKAKDFADEKNIELIVTGEVLNERPMSQHKSALLEIEKEAKLEGRLLRPLSAKLLDETNAEKEKRINREDFFAISGRKREKQIELAKKFKIDFPTPAGGCLLCEKEYCKKLKEILKNPDLSYHDIELLRIGRHFDSSKIILGKNQQENALLEKEKGIKIIPNQPGPTALVRDASLIEKAKFLIQKYSKNKISDFTIKKD